MKRWATIGLLLVIGVAAVWSLRTAHRKAAQLHARLADIVAPSADNMVPCDRIAAQHPLVLLALGQSNAGNHGSTNAPASPPVFAVVGERCFATSDPLPGGTGRGGSIWSRLPAQLAPDLGPRPVVLAVLAVDATSIDDWTDDGSELRKRLLATLDPLRRIGLPPDLVLWQQGEADARAGSSRDRYRHGLTRLAEILAAGEIRAPIFLARSTLCASGPNPAIQEAIADAAASDRRFRLGPDTDQIVGPGQRSPDGCHFDAAGLDRAARMWATTILDEIRRTPVPNGSPSS